MKMKTLTRARRNFGFGLLKSCLTFGYLTCSVRSKKIPHSTLLHNDHLNISRSPFFVFWQDMKTTFTCWPSWVRRPSSSSSSWPWSSSSSSSPPAAWQAGYTILLVYSWAVAKWMDSRIVGVTRSNPDILTNVLNEIKCSGETEIIQALH